MITGHKSQPETDKERVPGEMAKNNVCMCTFKHAYLVCEYLGTLFVHITAHI